MILTPNGRLNGEAQAVSADGQTIVGGGYKFGHAAWIWRAETGVRPIGVHGAGTFTALDVSDIGHVVVGFIAESGQGRVDERGFIWSEGKDPAQIDEFLKKHGAVVPTGRILSVASLISADGKTIYGWGFNPDGLVEMFKIELE